MIKKLNIVPKWVIFIIDLLISYFAFLVAHFIKGNLSLSSVDLHTLSGNILVLLLLSAISFTVFKTYDGIIRYAGFQDILRVCSSVIATSAFLFFFSLFSTFFGVGFYFSAVILILNLVFATLFLVSYRMVAKSVINHWQYIETDKKNVIIYGAGEAAFATKRVLENDYSSNIRFIAFIDSDVRKVRKVVDGIRIYHPDDLEKIISGDTIDEVIIADFSLSSLQRKEVVDVCLNHNIQVLNVPPVENWIKGQFSARQLQAIKIESLLERDPIKLNNLELAAQIKNTCILVTGAAGSIGSELVRQLLKYEPQTIILCDQAETPLHHLELELQILNKSRTVCVPFLSDVTNKERMRELFKKFHPDFVYHAAAYKHVPMMEISPSEAILNNSFGTKIVADLSIEFRVKRFVMVSTDKAVNPSNIMGTSKRLAEVYIQHLHKRESLQINSINSGDTLENENTRFIITRFGNVLGTNGSVVSIFKEQIEKGGPVTVTHPGITRYFMTIPESCQLVLEAGSMGKGGEIFVFDMGEPVAIAELAKKMIRLYNMVPGTDIDIIFSGLRPGEKLYEELWTDSESLLPTHHQKIMIVGSQDKTKPDFDKDFDFLISIARQNKSELELVSMMKKMVPEFLSHNSDFQKLDKAIGN